MCLVAVTINKINDAITSERSIFLSKNRDYKSLAHVALNPLIPVFLDLTMYMYVWWQKTRNTHNRCYIHGEV